MSQASISICKDYKQGNISKAVEDAIDYVGGIEKYVPKNAKVLIKPNMLAAKTPSEAVTTHPEVLRAVIKQVKKQTIHITVGDSPGFGSFDSIAEKTGIGVVCKEEGVTLKDLIESVKIKNEKGKILKVFNISKEATVAEVIINIPKLKTHSLTTYTGAVKNIFGFIPGKEKMGYHLKLSDPELFSHMLIDINLAIKSDLVIMDAVDIMEGDGPNAGEKRRLGLIIGADSSFAADAAATKIVAINEIVPSVQLAIKRGITSADIKNVTIKGEPLNKVSLKEPIKLAQTSYSSWLVKNPFFKFAKKIVSTKPVVEKRLCTKCQTCNKVCPTSPKAVVFINKESYPKWNYDECIKCYTCAEYCPTKAIKIRKGLF